MSEYANIKYSRELAGLFPDSTMVRVEYLEHGKYVNSVVHRYSIPKGGYKGQFNGSDEWTVYPAITIQMALDVLPEKIESYEFMITRFEGKYTVGYNEMVSNGMETMGLFSDESLPNSLCKMIQHLKKEAII